MFHQVFHYKQLYTDRVNLYSRMECRKCDCSVSKYKIHKEDENAPK